MKNWIDTNFTTIAENGEETRAPSLGGAETNSDVQYSVYDRGDDSCLVRVTAFPAEMDTIVNATETTVVTDADVDSDESVPFSQTGDGPGLENLDQPDVEVDDELDNLSPSDVLTTDEMQKAYLIHNWTRGPLDREDRQTILADFEATSLRELLYEADASEIQTIVNNYSLGSFPGNLDTSTIARSVIQNQTVGRQVLQDQETTAMNKVAKAKGLDRADELSQNTRDEMSGEMGHKCKCMLEGQCAEQNEMLDYIKGRRSDSGVPWDGDVNPPAKGNPFGGN